MNLLHSIKRVSSKLKATKTEQELWDEVAISAMNSLMPVYWDTRYEYGSSEKLLKCHIESAFEYADEFMKQRSERLSSFKEI